MKEDTNICRTQSTHYGCHEWVIYEQQLFITGHNNDGIARTKKVICVNCLTIKELKIEEK